MMHIAFCTDTNYVMPCGVAMTSICENNKEEEICFHLMITDEGTAPDEVEKKVAPLRDIAERYKKEAVVYALEAEKIKSFVCRESYISTTAFSRIFLPEILSDEIEKVIYLDCDLVCDGSLKELWETELEDDCPVGAVVDSEYAAVQGFLRAQISSEYFYVNSGVLLMNLDCWRRNDYVNLAVKIAMEKRFPLIDQDTINHIFCGKIKYLPVKYNVSMMYVLDGWEHLHITMDYYSEIIEACKNPIIIHYQSPNKPWHNEKCPYRENWEKYSKLTIWRDYNTTPVVTRFDRTSLFDEFEKTYWHDPIRFNICLQPLLRFFRASARLKNKSLFVRISSTFLNSFAAFLEKVYAWKTRK